eukprot:GILK01004899.1.p1 GENE.GILK01004899.1~~GILK01004899.1.p1  ORF type:complete len:1879 (+),score=385.22 GILK01004899.1:797-5638(+)
MDSTVMAVRDPTVSHKRREEVDSDEDEDVDVHQTLLNSEQDSTASVNPDSTSQLTTESHESTPPESIDDVELWPPWLEAEEEDNQSALSPVEKNRLAPAASILPGLNDVSVIDSDESDARKLATSRMEEFLQKTVELTVLAHHLEPQWQSIIFELAKRACCNVRNNVKDNGDKLDIRPYVKIKRIPGGSVTDSFYIDGVVCRKNIAHKKMRTRIDNPRILLLACGLEFQRVENRLSSFDTLIDQEKEYIEILVAKVLALKPDLIIVNKTVSRLAKEFLRQEKITLVLNVPIDLMQRIARCTRARILPSPDHADKVSASSILGMCKTFRTERCGDGEESKTLMFFEGCPANLGCTICLRGMDFNQLSSAKDALRWAVHVAFNLRLETEYMLDSCAVIPEPKDESPSSQLKLPAESFSSLCLSRENSRDPGSSSKDEESETATTATTGSTLLRASMSLKRRITAGTQPGTPQDKTRLSISLSQSGVQSELLPLSSPTNDDTEEVTLSHPMAMQAEAMQEYAKSVHHRHERRSGPSHHLSLPSAAALMLNQDYDSIQTCSEESDDLCLYDPLGQFPGGAELDGWQERHRVVYTTLLLTNGWQCVPPKVDVVRFYSEEDMPLGRFLSSWCFDVSRKCVSDKCRKLVLNHSLCYAHHKGRLRINVENAVTQVCDSSKILMWSFCKKCEREVTPRKEMSNEMWSYSFAKFLEQTFYNDQAVCRTGGCGHLVHRDLVRYFGQAHMVARMEFDPLRTYSIRARPRLSTDYGALADLRDEAVSNLSDLAASVLDGIRTKLDEINDQADQFLGEAALDSNQDENQIRSWTRINSDVQEMRGIVARKQESFFLKLWELAKYADRLELYRLQRFFYADVLEWKAIIEDMLSRRPSVVSCIPRTPTLESAKAILSGLTSPGRRLSVDPLEIVKGYATDSAGGLEPLSPFDGSQGGIDVRPDPLAELGQPATTEPDITSPEPELTSESVLSDRSASESTVVPPKPLITVTPALSPNGYVTPSVAVPVKLFQPSPSRLKSLAGSAMNTSERGSLLDALTKLLIGSPDKEELFQFPLLKEFQVGHLDLPPGVHGTVIPVYEDEPTSIVAYTLASVDYNSQLVSSMPGFDNFMKERVKEIDLLKAETIKKILTENETQQRQEQQQQNDKNSNKSTTVGQTVTSIPVSDNRSLAMRISFTGVAAVLNGMERPVPADNTEGGLNQVGYESVQAGSGTGAVTGPGTVAGTVLSSDEQREREEKNRVGRSQSESVSITKDQIPSHHASLSIATANSYAPHQFFFCSLAPTEDQFKVMFLSKEKLHIKCSFTDGFNGNETHFNCTVYFAKQFHALRQRYCGGDRDYIQSLARCKKFDTTGGKSGAFFSLSADGRFVIKHISRTELKMFVETGLSYFEYMFKAFYHNVPTLLCKILGVYQITYKDSASGRRFKEHIVVMENLLYGVDRTKCRIFDLKGGLRNRFVKPTPGKELEEVMQDQNYLEMMLGFPTPLRQESKILLDISIFNDTLYLSKLNVVDYSLLVAFDEERGLVEAGIIDYLRQYTWDKQLETVGKSLGMIAGKSMPTVISPKAYKLRFRMATDRYFMMMPDRGSFLSVVERMNQRRAKEDDEDDRD